jgi:hypothetical protein
MADIDPRWCLNKSVPTRFSGEPFTVCVNVVTGSSRVTIELSFGVNVKIAGKLTGKCLKV